MILNMGGPNLPQRESNTSFNATTKINFQNRNDKHIRTNATARCWYLYGSIQLILLQKGAATTDSMSM